MIKHIVMWKFVDEKDGKTKAEIMETVKKGLLRLPAIVPEIKAMEIGEDVLKTDDASYDMALITLFDSAADLHAYKVHPEHVKVSEYVKTVRTARATADIKC